MLKQHRIDCCWKRLCFSDDSDF